MKANASAVSSLHAHEVPAAGAKRRVADHVVRESRLHAEHRRRIVIVKQGIAGYARDGKSELAESDAGLADCTFGNRLVETHPRAFAR